MTTVIVCLDLGRAIGRAGDLIFHLRADLQRFKRLTVGHTVVMGRRTFESLPKGALPERRNIVVTSNPGWSATGAERAGSLDEALAMAAGSEVFIIGGARLYQEAVNVAGALEITVVHARAGAADTFFPAIDLAQYEIASVEPCDSEPRASFVRLVRRMA